MIREKETFRLEGFTSIDGEDVKCYVKASVNYERLTYKVQPIITLIHGWGKEIAQAFTDLVQQGIEECKARLEQYREEVGIGTQGDLFDNDYEGEAEGARG